MNNIEARQLRDAQRERAIELRSTGMTVDAIAAELGLTKKKVWGLLSSHSNTTRAHIRQTSAKEVIEDCMRKLGITGQGGIEVD